MYKRQVGDRAVFTRGHEHDAVVGIGSLVPAAHQAGQLPGQRHRLIGGPGVVCQAVGAVVIELGGIVGGGVVPRQRAARPVGGDAVGVDQSGVCLLYTSTCV